MRTDCMYLLNDHWIPSILRELWKIKQNAQSYDIDKSGWRLSNSTPYDRLKAKEGRNNHTSVSRQKDHSGQILLHIVTEIKTEKNNNNNNNNKTVTRNYKTLPRSLKPILDTQTLRITRTWIDGL